jgi:hypothetical protein
VLGDRLKNLGGWLTTVLARVCLNMLHSRQVRREEPSPFTSLTPSSTAHPTYNRRRRSWPTRSALRSSSCSTP